jgi:hypothetical protein
LSAAALSPIYNTYWSSLNQGGNKQKNADEGQEKDVNKNAETNSNHDKVMVMSLAKVTHKATLGNPSRSLAGTTRLSAGPHSGMG